MSGRTVLLLICCASTLFGQNELEENLENLVNLGQNVDLQSQIEAREKLRAHGLAINFAKRDELMASGLFDIFQVNNLLQYRERSGYLFSPAELMQVKGFDAELVHALEPLLNFSIENPKLKLHRPWDLDHNKHQIHWRLARDLNERQAYRSGHYAGDAWESRFRYRYRNGRKLELGLLLQKDPGETWQSESNFLAHDHSSFFLSIKEPWQFEEIIIGDFQHQFGQGLNLGSGRAFDNSLQSGDLQSYSRGIRAYAGSDENLFFRGIAVSKSWQHFSLISFLSAKHQDARLSEGDSLVGEVLINSGLHRSPSEIEQKNALTLFSSGLDLEFENQNWQIGLLYFLEKRSLKESNSSRPNHRLGAHFNYLFDQFNAFGEIGSLNYQKPSFCLGIQLPWTERIRAGLSLQKLQIEEQNRWRNNPLFLRNRAGEKSINALLCIKWNYHSRSSFKAQASRLELPSYGISGPSEDLRLKAIHRWAFLGNEFELMSQWRAAFQYDGLVEQRELGFRQEEKAQVSFKLKRPLSKRWRLKSRVALSYSKDPSPRYGMLWFNQLSGEVGKWQIHFALSLSDIENWENRIYQYEQDLALSFSIPAYYGRATRSFLMVERKLGGWIRFQVKGDFVSFHDRNRIGSGQSEIDEPHKFKLKSQLIIKL